MDSTAYKAAIIELQPLVGRDSPMAPYVFVRSGVEQSKQALNALASFLDCILPPKDKNDELREDSCWILHPLLRDSSSAFLGTVIAEMHRNIASRMRDDVSETPAIRRNCSEIVTFLINAVHPHRCPLFRQNDCTGFAMAVFLIETGMGLGWCPNALEGLGKRAAHLYFVHTKKSLVSAGPSERATVLAYLWGAWLMAQRTEGIRDHALAHESRTASYSHSFQTENWFRTYSSFHFTRSPWFFTIAHGIGTPVSAFRQLAFEGETGLRLWANGMPLLPFDFIEHAPINRQRITGTRIAYRFRTPESGIVRWLTVVQLFENTIYRIDMLRAEEKPLALSRVLMTYENALPLIHAGGGIFKGIGPENFIVQLIDNPLGLEYAGQDEIGVSVFEGCGCTIGCTSPVQMTSAWRMGSGVQEIDRTFLPGIFDI